MSAVTDIQWYPGHMAKTKKKLREDLVVVDLILEVLDARVPSSSLNLDYQALFA